MKTKWNCLKDVRDYLISNNLERVISFNGYELITDNHIYTLAFKKLNKKGRNND